MRKIKYSEAIIAILFIPIMIKLHNHVKLILKYDWIVYLTFNFFLLINLTIRVYHESNVVIIRNLMIFSYCVVTSLCLSIYLIENTPFIFALVISICGGGIIGIALSIIIILFRKLTSKTLSTRNE